MTHAPAPALSAEELAVVARFDAAPVPAEVVEAGATACPTSIQWLDDSPSTPCVLPKGHGGPHTYEGGAL